MPLAGRGSIMWVCGWMSPLAVSTASINIYRNICLCAAPPTRKRLKSLAFGV